MEFLHGFSEILLETVQVYCVVGYLESIRSRLADKSNLTPIEEAELDIIKAWDKWRRTRDLALFEAKWGEVGCTESSSDVVSKER